MKILQVITLSESGGAQSVVINLANSLCQEHEVMIAAGGDGAMWQQLGPRIHRQKIPSLIRSINFQKDLQTLLCLRKIYKEFRPDIIHLHSSKIGILGRLIFPAAKIVYTVHGFDSIRVAYRKFLPIEKTLKNRLKAIVAVSNYDYKNLYAENIRKNVYTVYNGITPVKTDPTIQASWDLTKKTILTIARIDPPKDFLLFIQTAKLLPQYNFIWIGNREIPQIDLPGNVSCLGEIPDASRYYYFADLCMLPSNYEGLPITIIEAMSCGKPVVASNVGGISEIVINGQTGYSLLNEAHSFAKKIEQILEDPVLYKTLSENAKQLFSHKLTVNKMVEQYLEIYNQ